MLSKANHALLTPIPASLTAAQKTAIGLDLAVNIHDKERKTKSKTKLRAKVAAIPTVG